MRTVLFYRDYQGFTGGHLKVWNYFQHVKSSGQYTPLIHFSPRSRWDETNPWIEARTEVRPEWQPEEADLLFLGGFDWEMLPKEERDRWPRPVINLVQHVHHGDPGHPLSAFLRHRAIRVCVSAEVQAAIERHGVNGPTVVIPNGIEMTDLPPVIRAEERSVDWLVCGLKEDRSEIARELARRMADEGGWGRVETLTKPLLRAEFLAALAQARNVVLLPRATEGFYLPALEAMALGCLVVCPDCVGNRSFCRDEQTALVPATCEVEGLLAAMRQTRTDPELMAVLVHNARATVAEHTLGRERAAFHELLASAEALW